MILIYYLLLIQGIFVILCINPILSLLFLISVYLSASVLFFFLGVEFLAILLIIIYVGAISILFIFVIMMLNLRIVEIYNKLIIFFL